MQELIKSHLIRTKDTTITEEIPRDLESLYQNKGQRANMAAKDAPSTVTTQEIRRVLEALC